MQLNDFNSEVELKFDLEPTKPLCRCCLSTERRMFDAAIFASYLTQLTGIEMQSFDSLPLHVCWECKVYLYKAVKFKQKVLKAHNILYEYVTRCAPFPIDAQDPELGKYASPILCDTEVQSFDTNGKGKLGYQKVLQHKKKVVHSLLDGLLSHERATFPVCKPEEDDIKEENGFSDIEDNIPLDEIRTTTNKPTVEDSTEVVKTETNANKSEDISRKRKTKIKKKEDKGSKRKRTEDPSVGDESMEQSRSSIRKTIELDPTKIRVVQLNPEEQIKQREEESKASLKFPYQCNLCFKGFNFEVKLDNHMQKHDPTRGPYECVLCRMYLPTAYSYSVHRLIHTQRYECVVCERRMIDKNSMLDHYRSQHEGLTTVITCQLCGKISTNSKTHRGHMRNHHAGSGRPECEQCGKTFVNKDSLADHLQIHLGVKNYACSVCGARFRTRSQIKHHHLKHTDERNYYCVECDVRFKTAQSLKQHLKKSVKHVDFLSLRYQCLQCEKRFETDQALNHHTLVQHEGFRGHRCEECGAALATANSLAKHIRTVHRGRRAQPRHVCDTCGKAFRGKSVLVNHVRTHTGEKPFACAVCGRGFAQRTAMRTHLRLVHMKLRRRNRVKPATGLESRGQKTVTEMVFAKEEPLPPTQPVYEPWKQQTAGDVFFCLQQS